MVLQSSSLLKRKWFYISFFSSPIKDRWNQIAVYRIINHWWLFFLNCFIFQIILLISNSNTLCFRLTYFHCNNFLIVVNMLNVRSSLLKKVLNTSTVLLTLRHKVVQQISRTFSSWITDTLYPLNSSLFPPLCSPWKPQFYFLFL